MKPHLDIFIVGLLILAASAYILYLIGRRWLWKKSKSGAPATPTCGCSGCPENDISKPS